jgi:plastocyanin
LTAPHSREAQQIFVRELRSHPRDLVRAAALASVLALGAAGCSSSANAGWTFAPEPSATPVPSTSGSAAPSGSAGTSASAAASNPAVSGAPGSPNPGGSNPAGGGTPGETTVRVAALNIAFDTQTIQAPGGQSFIIEFDNQDQATPHNIAIRDPAGADVFKGEIITGPAKATYQVPALTKGTAYTFLCEVHPNMTGTVTVQ